MKYKTELSRRKFKAGYVVIKGIVDGYEFGGPDFEMSHAETPGGAYIGQSGDAHFLCKKKGIEPELIKSTNNVCSIGFCEKEQKWYGWSHRAICGFAIGDTVEAGDVVTTSGWTDEYLANHPEEDGSLLIGFTAQTTDDAKRMAVAFASAVS